MSKVSKEDALKYHSEGKSKVAAGSRESSGPGTEEGPEGD